MEQQTSDENEQQSGSRLLPIGKLFPNFVTMMALCVGLSSIRFAMDGRWELAAISIIVAGILDGMDGRLARMLNSSSNFLAAFS